MNNLKRIAIALLNYQSAHGHFPPAVLYGPDGKTPYSWRVEILPHLGQQALFDMYHFDEPWDSPANRKVLETMVPVFCRSKEMTGSSTNTCYFALTGPGTMFDGKNGTRIAEIVDSTTNTILLVEAKRDVPWTKPEDIPYAADKPLPKLGGFADVMFNVVFADGHVVALLENTPEKLLRALITKDGGEPVDAKNPVVNPGPQSNQVWGPNQSKLAPMQRR
ncbi:MAG: DUF1559 domain-containing protein [Pirellulales bacterium]|nr:DUF1559 domain-containing protein [Pirellulales bacterium]